MTRSSSPANGLLFALASASLYGFNIVYARIASFAGASGSAIVVYRVFLMLVLVGIVAAVTRSSLKAAREERGTLLLLGVSTAFVGLCYLSSVAFIPVTVAAVVFYTFPILIVLASPFVEGTRLTPALLGVVALATLGVALVVGPAFGVLDWHGLALAFAASIATAIQFFAAARCCRTGIIAKTFWIHLLVFPTAALISLAAGQLAPPSALALAPFAVAMTIGGYIIGFVLQFVALGRITAVAAGIIYCAEPVVAALSSALILNETLAPLQVAGGALVLAAIIAKVLLDQRHLKDAPLVPIAD
ncbi:EamA family transporter [Microvirga tunisiensis]|jgi:drug/metabolite transporter (DMT)-like permease|uniref:DMT family transporter n=1 Tax=Microvirga tunisiensis TaxID=2108360 RepID=A0A5N7MEV8_9HYPH|nr:DMT family transporter [Microvirga tunisiensis]MPR06542.1 DMT family transporter [Microvirga tunisiensis]MPR24664.1 DMT family transporter [Microvirga tunisiensis]